MTVATLIIAASEQNADMLYISGLFVPDPFIAIKLENEWHGLFSPLEVDRARKESKLKHVHLDSSWKEKAGNTYKTTNLAAISAQFLSEYHVSRVIVPGHFPVVYADQLRLWGFEVEAAQGELFQSRCIKSEEEICHLTKAERLTRNAMRQAEHFLAKCSIGNDGILLHPEITGKIKAKHLRSAIETYLIQHGAMPAHTIVACGKESSDPHNIGHGYLRAHQPIIIDIFPRVLASGYWGDMTRTYVKGLASAEIKALYQTVKSGQDIGLGMVADGVDGAKIHRAITEYFDSQGFKTGIVNGKQTGFFHGTGHGVGLEIHEAPRVSTISNTLKSGQVITIEPGLYYPNLGGVRIEDMVVVRKDGHTNLTRHARKLEIK